MKYMAQPGRLRRPGRGPEDRREISQQPIHSTASHTEILTAPNGPGLGGVAPERLFEPFFSTKPQGLGVGLAISRSIIERHCGHLQATESEAGVRFSFTLPVHRHPAMVTA